MHFLCAEGKPGAQIYLCMCEGYRDKVLFCRVIYEWIEIFKNDCESVSDTECFKRPHYKHNHEELQENCCC